MTRALCYILHHKRMGQICAWKAAIRNVFVPLPRLVGGTNSSGLDSLIHNRGKQPQTNCLFVLLSHKNIEFKYIDFTSRKVYKHNSATKAFWDQTSILTWLCCGNWVTNHQTWTVQVWECVSSIYFKYIFHSFSTNHCLVLRRRLKMQRFIFA